MKREIKIGLFLTGAFVILAVIIFIVGDLAEAFRRPGYVLNVRISSALGLEKRSDVKMAGIRIGYVKDIVLDQRRARVVMNIYPRFKVPKGSKATLASLGLLGERFMEIVPGGEADYFAPGESLEGLPTVSFDQIGTLFLSIGDEIKQLSVSLKDVLGKDNGANLKQALRNLSSLTAELDSFLSENKGGLGATVRNASRAVEDVGLRLREVSDNINKAVAEYSALAGENRDGVKRNMKKVEDLLDEIGKAVGRLNESLDKVRKSEGSLGKLINEPALYDEVEGAVADVRRVVGPVSSILAGVEVRGDYYGSSDLVKGSLGLSLRSGGKLFLAGIAHDPWRDRFVYSLQGGLRWGGLAPRAGIIESEFGAGVDYYAFKDRLAVGVEGFDLNRAPGPRFRLYSKYYPGKNVFLVAGVDDFTLASDRKVFFGLGVGLR
ncbi:MAG TPA: MlaD family protein [Acidobacteriota bacterium]|nr:MlaD family protein [Acidobacteriota bacterium]